MRPAFLLTLISLLMAGGFAEIIKNNQAQALGGEYLLTISPYITFNDFIPTYTIYLEKNTTSNKEKEFVIKVDERAERVSLYHSVPYNETIVKFIPNIEEKSVFIPNAVVVDFEGTEIIGEGKQVLYIQADKNYTVFYDRYENNSNNYTFFWYVVNLTLSETQIQKERKEALEFKGEREKDGFIYYRFKIPKNQQNLSLRLEIQTKFRYGEWDAMILDAGAKPPKSKLEIIEYIDPFWNTSWAYCRNYTIYENGTINYTNTFPLTIDTASLISSSKLNGDCSDARFIQEYPNGTQVELNYFIEPTTCNTSYTTIWLRGHNLIKNTNNTIKFCYGNPSATDKSNGSAVFDVYVNFTGKNITNCTSLGTQTPLWCFNRDDSYFNFSVEDGALKFFPASYITSTFYIPNKYSILGQYSKIYWNGSSSPSGYLHIFYIQKTALGRRAGIESPYTWFITESPYTSGPNFTINHSNFYTFFVDSSKPNSITYGVRDGTTNSVFKSISYFPTSSLLIKGSGTYGKITMYLKELWASYYNNTQTIVAGPEYSGLSLTLISPSGTINNHTIQINYSILGIGIDKCWYSLDGGENISLPSCANTSITINKTGTHNITLYANSTTGLNSSASKTFLVNLSYCLDLLDDHISINKTWNQGEEYLLVSGYLELNNTCPIGIENTTYTNFAYDFPFSSCEIPFSNCVMIPMNFTSGQVKNSSNITFGLKTNLTVSNIGKTNISTLDNNILYIISLPSYSKNLSGFKPRFNKPTNIKNNSLFYCNLPNCSNYSLWIWTYRTEDDLYIYGDNITTLTTYTSNASIQYIISYNTGGGGGGGGGNPPPDYKTPINDIAQGSGGTIPSAIAEMTNNILVPQATSCDVPTILSTFPYKIKEIYCFIYFLLSASLMNVFPFALLLIFVLLFTLRSEFKQIKIAKTTTQKTISQIYLIFTLIILAFVGLIGSRWVIEWFIKLVGGV